jgi:murein L,D-transpeptidase YcbB/YkuD
VPKLAQDPAYLQKHRMRVVGHDGRQLDPATVDWSAAATGAASAPRIVQSAGADNSLGRVKFMFPNEHSVYLHDTPMRALFERTQRAYSSGCIRVENPLRLAELLLDDPVHWGRAQLEAAIASGKTQTIAVRRNVPVLLLYFTAQVGCDGALRFRPDFYRRDPPIVRGLAAAARFGAMAPPRQANAAPQR